MSSLLRVLAAPAVAFLVSTGTRAADMPGAMKVPKVTAFEQCITTSDPDLSWSGPPREGASVSWSTLGSSGERILYRVRYQWPSEVLDGARYQVVTEVLFEGTEGEEELHPLLTLPFDETFEGLAPLRLHRVGSKNIIEAHVCMNGTGGCWQSFHAWVPGAVRPLENRVRSQVDAWLPEGYRTAKSPLVDLGTLTGEGGAWSASDGNCCPSRHIRFTVALFEDAVGVRTIAFADGPP
jgi:hypothetical protein